VTIPLIGVGTIRLSFNHAKGLGETIDSSGIHLPYDPSRRYTALLDQSLACIEFALYWFMGGEYGSNDNMVLISKLGLDHELLGHDWQK
jgi:hypothetical protein